MTNFSRREFLVTAATAIASSSLISQMAFARTEYQLPLLPYDPEALMPSIDAETMRIHHEKHHKAYVDKLNEQISSLPALQSLSLEQIISDISKYPEGIRNSGGGHFNHSFFWKLMAPIGSGGEPSAALKKEIDDQFGGMEPMKASLNASALALFGSGWGWLILGNDKKLRITTTPNQDNPLMDVAAIKGIPLIGVDVWEHAYYLKYQNRRAEYLKNWWSVINWNEVNSRFAAI